jgi:spermidine synthase
MGPRELIAESTTPDGDPLSLTIEHGEHVVRVRGETLMSARTRGSEQAMATLAFACAPLDGNARILVAGLGMGFTLRAVLDQASPDAHISVIELFTEVLQWNQGPLASLAGQPLDDPRVTVIVGDLLDYLATNTEPFDAILLDIDNGPEAFTVAGNDRLYQGAGLALLHRALSIGGAMVLWSAFRSTAFEKRLGKFGFAARSVSTRARADVGKGARHTLFVAIKNSANQALKTPRVRKSRAR